MKVKNNLQTEYFQSIFYIRMTIIFNEYLDKKSIPLNINKFAELSLNILNKFN